MSFEDRILGNIDRRRAQRMDLPPMLEKAYLKAQEVLRNPDYSIQMEDFRDVYGEQVDKEVAIVRDLERKFKQEETPQSKNTKKVADVLEAVVLTQSELSEWLGNATTLRSAPYDDYVNKVDMLAEWYTPQDGSRLLALCVDVTFGPTAIDKKLTEIRREIDSGKLGTVKYFKDIRENFKGSRFNVPRTVIGIGQGQVEQLARLWIEGEKKQLGTHPVQRVFIDQIHSQLLLMHEYARASGKKAVMDSIEEALAAVSPVYSSKVGIDASALATDPVVEEIARRSREVFRV